MERIGENKAGTEGWGSIGKLLGCTLYAFPTHSHLVTPYLSGLSSDIPFPGVVLSLPLGNSSYYPTPIHPMLA